MTNREEEKFHALIIFSYLMEFSPESTSKIKHLNQMHPKRVKSMVDHLFYLAVQSDAIFPFLCPVLLTVVHMITLPQHQSISPYYDYLVCWQSVSLTTLSVDICPHRYPFWRRAGWGWWGSSPFTEDTCHSPTCLSYPSLFNSDSWGA